MCVCVWGGGGGGGGGGGYLVQILTVAYPSLKDERKRKALDIESYVQLGNTILLQYV